VRVICARAYHGTLLLYVLFLLISVSLVHEQYADSPYRGGAGDVRPAGFYNPQCR
jgi:hypothetical protein